MAAGKVDMAVRIVSPDGYQPAVDLVASSGADAIVTDDLTGVVGADVIYTDVWTSMGQEAEREQRLATFPPYQLNDALLTRTRNSDVKVMHCLPAHRGEEISDDVADGPNSLLFAQAHNRMHAQKALLAHLIGGVPLE
jgi:ornithine carbamoyltransferase